MFHQFLFHMPCDEQSTVVDDKKARTNESALIVFSWKNKILEKICKHQPFFDPRFFYEA